MPLNESKGNMYSFVTHTWNPIKGVCSHDCVYCYMKQFKQKPVRLDEKELKTNLGEDNFIFVGSGTDMWAEDILFDWILRVLHHCRKFSSKYLFQTKNPKRFIETLSLFHKTDVLGTTIETNRYDVDCDFSTAPTKNERFSAMRYLKKFHAKTMITIEPIMDFDVIDFAKELHYIKPDWVNIGADSKRHNLPEPSWDKVQALIVKLKKFTEVKCKSNLNRLKEKKA